MWQRHTKPEKGGSASQHGYVWLLVYLLLLCYGCEASSRYNQGTKLLSQGDYRRAVDEFDSALLLKPDYEQDLVFQQHYRKAKAGAHLAKGSEYVEIGEWEKAVSEFLLALNEDASFPGAATELAAAKKRASRLHFEKGNARLREENVQMAIREFETSVEYDPNSSEAQEALEQTLYIRGEQHTKAEEMLARAQDLVDRKDWLAAKTELEECLRLNSGLIAARSLLETAKEAVAISQQMWGEAALFLQEKGYDAAIHKLEELIAYFPSYPEVKAELERVKQLRKEAFATAAEHFKSSESMINEKNWRAAREGLAKCLSVYPEYPDASRLLAQLAANVKQGEDLFNQAQALFVNKRLNKTRELLHRLVEDDPFHPKVPTLREKCEKSVAEAESLLLAAEKEVQASDWQGAIDHYEKAAEINKDITQEVAHSVLKVKQLASETEVANGSNLLETKEYDSAAMAFQSALFYDPNCHSAKQGVVKAFYRVAQTRLEEGLVGHALVKCTQARLYFDPNDKPHPIEMSVMAALRESIAYSLVIPRFGVEESTPKATPILGSVLIGEIHKAKPESCEVVVVDEFVSSPHKTPQFYLRISASGFVVELVDNPEYRVLSNKVERLSKKVSEDEAKLEELNRKVELTEATRVELTTLLERLWKQFDAYVSREHPYIDDPTYVELKSRVDEVDLKEYEVKEQLKDLKADRDWLERIDLRSKQSDLQMARRSFERASRQMLTCTGSIAMQLIDPKKKVVFSQTFDESVSLPADKGQQKVVSETISALARRVSASLKHLFDTIANMHLVNARKLDTVRDSEAALEEYVKYLISGISQDEPGFQEAQTAVKRIAGISLSLPLRSGQEKPGNRHRKQKTNAVRQHSNI